MVRKRGSGIKAVIFDIGGVLLFGDEKVRYGHQNINVHNSLSKKYGLSLKKWFEIIGEDYKKAITGEQDKEKIYTKLAKKLKTGHKKLEKDFVKAHKKYFRKNKGLSEFANKLNKDYYVGILSDQTPASKEAFLEKLDTEDFDPVVLSCDVGVRKPDKKIYRILKRELDKLEKTKYEEILFIDNREWNLKPARELGMQTVLFKTNKQTIKELNGLLKDDKK